MKIRIKANTIRLRLTQSEVDQFAQDGYVASTLRFDAQHSLTYALARKAEATRVQANFEDHTITIEVPLEVASTWTDTNQVGFQSSAAPVDTGSEEDPIFVLVEKDFQCLHKRPHEDEKDNFPNPLQVDQ